LSRPSAHTAADDVTPGARAFVLGLLAGLPRMKLLDHRRACRDPTPSRMQRLPPYQGRQNKTQGVRN
jgi:hypothetical protein